MHKSNLVKNTKLIGIGVGGFILIAIIAFGLTTVVLNLTSPTTSNSATSSSKKSTSSSSSSTTTTADSSSSSATSSASYASASATAVKTYTVGSGETLTSIFRNFGTNHGLTTAEAQAQILAVNADLTVNSQLQTGQVINLPDLP